MTWVLVAIIVLGLAMTVLTVSELRRQAPADPKWSNLTVRQHIVIWTSFIPFAAAVIAALAYIVTYCNNCF